MTTNPVYSAAAIEKVFADFDRGATQGHINDPLFATACRIFEFVNAGAIDEQSAYDRLEQAARTKGHAAANIKDTLASARRHVAGNTATIPAPMSRQHSPPIQQKLPSVYQGLADYERQHGAAAGAFAAAGWFDCLLWEQEYLKDGKILTALKETKPDTYLRERRAIGFLTPAGNRYRLVDGLPGRKYWHPTHTHERERKPDTKTLSVWYRLHEAIQLAQANQQRIVLCNGEASVVAAQAMGVAAVCTTGGGEHELPDRLLQELLTAWSGDFIVALDCDDKGRKAAPKLAAQLQAAGRAARAVDLQLDAGGDLADFVHRHGAKSVVDLATTIPDLIAQPTEFVQGPRLLHADQLSTIPQATWLIDGVLAIGKLSQTFAPPGSGKSFLELDKALHVAQHAPVVYVAGEAIEDYQERVQAWCSHYKRSAGQMYFWPEPVMLKDAAAVDAFLSEVYPIQPAAIFFDPLASCMVGLEESSTGDMAIAVEALNRIRRETGAAVHIVHHTGWADTHERGSSVLRAACRVVMKLSLDDSGLMTLTCEKTNSAKPFEARYFRLVASENSAVPVPATKLTVRDAPLSERQIAILEALEMAHFRNGASFSQITDHVAFAKSTVNKSLSTLLERGYIAAEGQRSKVYALTDKGRDELLIRLADTVSGGSSLVHQGGELGVNWTVNSQRTSSELPHLNAEFTEFTAESQNQPVVHPPSEPLSSSEFTDDIASECGSSPEFTVSSPSVHSSEFTSSPGVCSKEHTGSEQAEENSTADDPFGGMPSYLVRKYARANDIKELRSLCHDWGIDVDQVLTEAKRLWPEYFIPSTVIALANGRTQRQIILTENWQEVPAAWVIPSPSETRLDMATGKNYARLVSATE